MADSVQLPCGPIRVAQRGCDFPALKKYRRRQGCLGIQPICFLATSAAFCFFNLFTFDTTLAGVQTGSEAPSVEYTSPTTVKAWLNEGKAVTFLDVRKPEEFAAGHLPGAMNTVYDQVPSLIDQLPSDRPIISYCTHSAYRAPAAAKILMELGRNNVYVLEGGIVAWRAGDLEIRAENLAKEPRILPPPDCICGEVKKT